MKSKAEIRAKIKCLRTYRNHAQRLQNTEGYIFLSNGAIRALEWVLGYKRKDLFWCFECGVLHQNLKCPKCGNERQHEMGDTVRER